MPASPDDTIAAIEYKHEHEHEHEHEAARLAALRSYRVFDAPPEAGLERLVALAASLLSAPIAYVSFVDESWIWIHAGFGIAPARAPRDTSLCGRVILAEAAFVANDARAEPVLCECPMVAGPPHARFYAGAPLVTPDGHRIGALCVMDTAPRAGLSPDEDALLHRLAALVMDHLTLRRAEFANAAANGFATASEFAFLAIDGAGAITFVNPACEATFGYTRQEMLGRGIELIIPEPFRDAHKAGLARIANGCPSKLTGKTIELTAQRRNGEIFPIEFSLSVWRDRAGVGISAIMRDISAWRERDAKLVRMAHHDKLTGLANRASFDERLDEVLAAGRRGTILMLDLDGFKDVNDSLGHATGDALLQAVAVRLPTCFEAGAMVARFGGDEFAALLPGSADPLAAEAAARAIIDAFHPPFQVSGHTFHVSVSIGAALSDGEGAADELIANADLALYGAKRDGRRCFRLFQPAMRSSVVARRAMHEELNHALEAGELTLHYQPQVILATGDIVGVEALLRWRHPTRGLLLPGSFLPAVEAHPLVADIGRWIIEEACRQAAAWRAAGAPPLRVSVNLFSAQLRTGLLVSEVMSSLSRYRLAPESFELEVTERIALHVDDAIIEPLRDLHACGVGIAFDDFGTGYASLSSLKRFPLSRLKIDRSFVRDVLTDRHDADIIRAVMVMARSFGLAVIAEGIETRAQEEALQVMRCDEGQGYLYGRALTANALMSLVKRGVEAPIRASA